jgi:hypothetical protein
MRTVSKHEWLVVHLDGHASVKLRMGPSLTGPAAPLTSPSSSSSSSGDGKKGKSGWSWPWSSSNRKSTTTTMSASDAQFTISVDDLSTTWKSYEVSVPVLPPIAALSGLSSAAPLLIAVPLPPRPQLSTSTSSSSSTAFPDSSSLSSSSSAATTTTTTITTTPEKSWDNNVYIIMTRIPSQRKDKFGIVIRCFHGSRRIPIDTECHSSNPILGEIWQLDNGTFFVTPQSLHKDRIKHLVAIDSSLPATMQQLKWITFLPQTSTPLLFRSTPRYGTHSVNTMPPGGRSSLASHIEYGSIWRGNFADCQYNPTVFVVSHQNRDMIMDIDIQMDAAQLHRLYSPHIAIDPSLEFDLKDRSNNAVYTQHAFDPQWLLAARPLLAEVMTYHPLASLIMDYVAQAWLSISYGYPLAQTHLHRGVTITDDITGHRMTWRSLAGQWLVLLVDDNQIYYHPLPISHKLSDRRVYGQLPSSTPLPEQSLPLPAWLSLDQASKRLKTSGGRTTPSTTPSSNSTSRSSMSSSSPAPPGGAQIVDDDDLPMKKDDIYVHMEWKNTLSYVTYGILHAWNTPIDMSIRRMHSRSDAKNLPQHGYYYHSPYHSSIASANASPPSTSKMFTILLPLPSSFVDKHGSPLMAVVTRVITYYPLAPGSVPISTFLQPTPPLETKEDGDSKHPRSPPPSSPSLGKSIIEWYLSVGENEPERFPDAPQITKSAPQWSRTQPITLTKIEQDLDRDICIIKYTTHQNHHSFPFFSKS